MINAEKNKKNYYGIIEAHRFNGGNPIYYGSKIPHDRGIELVISRSTHERSLHKDYYSTDEELISVRMTEGQFAELITGLNSRRVPCTLSQINGERMSEPEALLETRKKIDEELQKHLKEISERINSLYEKVENADFKRKGEKAEVLRDIQNFQTRMIKDTPFIRDSFDKEMDSIVAEAKNEVQYFIEDNLGKLDTLSKEKIALLKTIENE